jgi:D-galactonate transporter
MTEHVNGNFETSTYQKVTWRLLPFLFLCYILAYLDRVNVGFAKLQMQTDLGFSDAVYGAGAGIFFIGYFIFEVPSNLLLQKFGAKIWIARIMIVWGIISSCMVFIRDSNTFFFLRFLLGMAEAGFFPGIIYYLTIWYPRKYRSKMVALFMTAIALSGVFGGLVSGWILSFMSDSGGLRAWQWLFLLEGIPSIFVGILTLWFLDNGPHSARWLTEPEKNLLLQRLQEEEELKKNEGAQNHTLRDAFRSTKVWLLCAVYFGIIMGLYGFGFWLPQIIKDSFTQDPWKIGLISVIPWGLAAVMMVLAGHHSDATGERRWHVAIACLFSFAGFMGCGLLGSQGVVGLALITLATIGVMASLATFWALPTALLSGTAAAAGIAWINSVGNLAGYVGPFVIGLVRDTTHSMLAGFFLLSGCSMMSAIIVVRMMRAGPARP